MHPCRRVVIAVILSLSLLGCRAAWPSADAIRWNAPSVASDQIIDAMVGELRLRGVTILDADARLGFIRILSRHSMVFVHAQTGQSVGSRTATFLVRVEPQGSVSLAVEDGYYVRTWEQTRRCGESPRCMHPNLATEMQELAEMLRRVLPAPEAGPPTASPVQTL